MNSKAIILLLAIVSVGGMGITSQAFADESNEIPYRYLDGIDPNQLSAPISFEINNDTFDHDSIIIINGQVKTVKELDVVIVVEGPILLVPKKPLPDGTILDGTDVYACMEIAANGANSEHQQFSVERQCALCCSGSRSPFYDLERLLSVPGPDPWFTGYPGALR